MSVLSFIAGLKTQYLVGSFCDDDADAFGELITEYGIEIDGETQERLLDLLNENYYIQRCNDEEISTPPLKRLGALVVFWSMWVVALVVLCPISYVKTGHFSCNIFKNYTNLLVKIGKSI